MDGDTIAAICAGAQRTVRISSVDAPEKAQTYGAESKQFLDDLASGSDVWLEVVDYDRYGRIVGRLLLPDGRDVARELVRTGNAWHYVKYSKDPELAALEERARAERAGLWAYPFPEPPSVFRQLERERGGAARSRPFRRSEPRSARRSIRR